MGTPPAFPLLFLRISYLKENIFKYSTDFVQIFNGENESADELAFLTGLVPSLVESTGNTVFIKFQSDENHYSYYYDLWTGFKIFYEAGKGNCNQQSLIQYKFLLTLFCRISNLQVVVY